VSFSRVVMNQLNVPEKIPDPFSVEFLETAKAVE
jgi:hypothetical protein